MNPITVYQCFPAKNPLQTARKIFQITSICAPEILLDLEDSIQSIDFPEKNAELKAIARQDLAKLFSLLPQDRKYHVRINTLKSADQKCRTSQN